jgi:hypothetical protein
VEEERDPSPLVLLGGEDLLGRLVARWRALLGHAASR